MVSVKWVEEDGECLTIDGAWLTTYGKATYDLYQAYYNGKEPRKNVARKARHLRQQIKLGKIKMPEQVPPFDPETAQEQIEERLAEASKNLGGRALEKTTIVIPTEHLSYHEKLQEALDSEGRVESATFREGSHRGFIKNNDGEIEETNDLPNKRAEFRVSFDHEPKWPPINRVESVKLPKRERKQRPVGELQRAVILPDFQIPFHDPKAVEVALEIVRDVKPDKIVILGDLLDLSAWGKYLQRPEFADATNSALVEAHKLLVTLRKLCPSAEIDVIEGNHEVRMPKNILANNKEAFGIKRADQPEGWPVLSIPFLLAMDDLDVNYVSGYPANRLWINKHLQIRHGNLARAGNTAFAVAQQEKVSTIFGHIHRFETQMQTYHTFDGGKTIGAWSIGCLCDIMGSVPSTKNGYDLKGKSVQNAENWNQGLAVVEYDDEAFDVQPVFINTFDNYKACYGGKKYERE